MICVKTSHVCILFLRSWKRKTNVSRRIVGILMDILAAGGGGGGSGVRGHSGLNMTEELKKQ